MATKGFAAPEVESTYTRARELCQQVGETRQLFPVLLGLWTFYLVRGGVSDGARAGGAAPALWPSGSKTRRSSWRPIGALGSTLFWLGEFGAAQEHLEQGIALYDPQQHHSHAFLYGRYDPGCPGLSYAAWVLWYLGYPDQALKRSHEALTLAQELSHPFSLALALGLCCHAPSAPPGGAGDPRAGRGSDSLSHRARISVLVGGRGLSCGAGRWPSRDREKKGLPRYARAWPPCKP